VEGPDIKLPTLPEIKDEPLLDISFHSRSGDSINASNLSIEHSEVSIAGLGEPLIDETAIADLVAPSGEDTSVSSCSSRGEVPFILVYSLFDWYV
jgi:hypothetical protein